MKSFTTTAAIVAALTLSSTSPIIVTATPQSHQHQQCERLPTSLTYTQDKAPADVSAILRVVVDKINRDVKGVVDVEVNWSGAELHKRVGEHVVKCTVTRSTAANANATDEEEGEDGDGQSTTYNGEEEQQQKLVSQCFEVPFTILDVNECTVPPSSSMVHQCPPPSICVNTLGSYECLCPSEATTTTTSATNANHGLDIIEAMLKDEQFIPDGDFWQKLNELTVNKSPWELSLGSSSESSCPNMSSTHACCEEDGHSKEGKECRSSFHCPVDPCGDNVAAKNNRGGGGATTTRGKQQVGSSAATANCASNAICQRTPTPLSKPNYQCVCPTGLFGNGHECDVRNNERRVKQLGKIIEPKVKYDGVTPTEETRRALDSGLICGCVEAKVDVCDGFPKCPGKHEMCTVKADNTPTCTCQPGYVHDPDYGCVDESPPILNLRSDPTHSFDPNTGVVHLSQGDKYEEYGVDIIDDNAEEYLRSLKIQYSKPLPRGCLLEMDEFHVTYTVAMPWTTPEYVSARRTVIIDNVNECGVMPGSKGVGANCPELVAMCDVDAGASCKDIIGSYSCQCPEGTEGDGFLPISRLRSDGHGRFVGSMIPKGYMGGAGCRDVRKPVIELLGPNPKRFRVAKASGVHGIVKPGESEESHARVETLIVEQRSAYESDIRSLIEATSGAELCATTSKPNVKPSNCVRAQDHTYKGIVDLSSRVSIGEPIPKGNLQWKVPYTVKDDAGNEAVTVWRDIIVEEVEIEDFESKVRTAALANQKEEVNRAVNEALANERRKQQQQQQRNIKQSHDPCPPCEPCNCGNNRQKMLQGAGMMTASDCDAFCDKKIDAAVSTSSAAARSSDATCTPKTYRETGSVAAPNYQIVQEMLVFVEGLMGPSAMMLLLLGCTLATALYILRRMITALFFSTGPNVRTYYHTREDDDQERIMMQNVSYYRSPVAPSSSSSRGASNTHTTTPGSGASASSNTSSSGPRPPPRASISSQQQNGSGIFSPLANTGGLANGTPASHQHRTSPFHSQNGTGVDNTIYQSMSPITPRHNTPNGTPGSSNASQGSSTGQTRSPYKLRNANY